MALDLFRLQILLFPLQTSGAGPGKEPDFAFSVLHLPMLSGVVEFDVAGAVDFEAAKFMERNSFGPEALSGSVRIKRDLDVHSFGWMVGF